jgi:hypothetical protein
MEQIKNVKFHRHDADLVCVHPEHKPKFKICPKCLKFLLHSLSPPERIELIKQLLTKDIKHEVWELSMPTGNGHDVDQFYKE